jgi:tRNA-specific 2-thiouridylase
VAKNGEKNQLVVALEGSASALLHRRRFTLHQLHFIRERLEKPCRLLGRPRHRDPSQSLYFEPIGPDTAVVEFPNPPRALASGQVLALYEEKRLLGGGIYA